MLALLSYLPVIALIFIAGGILFFKKKPAFFSAITSRLSWVVFLLIFLNGMWYAFFMPYWSPIDEAAHFGYIQFISERGKLPLLSNYNSPEVLAIGEGRYPSPPKNSAENAGTVGILYESLQPPLAYILSLPFYWLGGSNFIHKIFALRLWGIFQLSLSGYIFFKTMEKVSVFFPEPRQFFMLSGIALVGFTPSLIVRAGTVSNSATPLLFGALFCWWMSRFLSSEKKFLTSDAIILGIFAGLLMLSRLTAIVIIPASMLFILIKTRKKFLVPVIFFSATICVLVAPWLWFNKANYGTWTANEQAKQITGHIVNPNNIVYTYQNYVSKSYKYFFGLIWIPPEDYWAKSNWGVNNLYFWELSNSINYLIFFGMIAGILVSLYQIIFRKKYVFASIIGISSATFLGGIAQLELASVLSNWPIMEGRYLHPIIFFPIFFFVFLSGVFYRIKYRAISFVLVSLMFILPLALNIEYIHGLNAVHAKEIKRMEKKKEKQEKKAKKKKKNETKINFVIHNFV